MNSSSSYQAEPLLDPVVDRVRESRRALAEACNFDVDRMADLFEQMEAQHPEAMATPKRTTEAYEPPPRECSTRD